MVFLIVCQYPRGKKKKYFNLKNKKNQLENAADKRSMSKKKNHK